jgi:hypothetical protein
MMATVIVIVIVIIIIIIIMIIIMITIIIITNLQNYIRIYESGVKFTSACFLSLFLLLV